MSWWWSWSRRGLSAGGAQVDDERVDAVDGLDRRRVLREVARSGRCRSSHQYAVVAEVHRAAEPGLLDPVGDELAAVEGEEEAAPTPLAAEQRRATLEVGADRVDAAERQTRAARGRPAADGRQDPDEDQAAGGEHEEHAEDDQPDVAACEFRCRAVATNAVLWPASDAGR